MAETREGVVIVPSLAAASAEEIAALPQNTEREREWYKDHRIFADHPEMLAALATGELVQIEGDENYALAGRMRNPEWYDQFTPYLLPAAASALTVVGQLWRDELEDRGLEAPDTLLSITSAGRHKLRQAEIVKDPTKLAVADSTHMRAAAFDIDSSGYYVRNENGILVPVVHPERKQQAGYRAAAEILQRLASPEHRYVSPEADKAYDPAIMDAIVAVADRLHKWSLVNRIVEYSHQNAFNRCLHIAPNPSIEFVPV
ncbi:MAG TPA: DUF5715 family protein [Candidatus Saccharimonadales bacterium]|nr:DUF5715 family protein [Candidatus Saccharimonadales bacterium]